MYEVVQAGGQWIVRRDGEELARFDDQALALQAVAEYLRREGGSDAPAAFALRFQNRDD